MFAVQHWNGLGWAIIRVRLEKCQGSKLRLLFKSFPGPLLKLGMGPLARYGNHQDIINRRPEQMYTSSDTRLEWHREGPLCESDPNKLGEGGAKRDNYSSHLLGHY